MATTAKSSTKKQQFVLVVRSQKGVELGFLNTTGIKGFSAQSIAWLEESAKEVLEAGEFIPTSGYSKEKHKEYIALQASLDPIADEIGIEKGVVIPFYFLHRWEAGEKKSVEWFIKKLSQRKLVIVKRRLKSKMTQAQLAKIKGESMLRKIFFPGGETVDY